MSFSAVSEVVWSEDFWLPPNVTWDELEPETTSNPNVNFRRFRDLGYPLMMVWVVLAVKYACEKKVFRAIGVALGLPDKKRSMPPTNDVLEAGFNAFQSAMLTNFNLNIRLN